MKPFRRFLHDLVGVYADGLRTMRGLPLLFAALIAWEFAQHVIEYRIGFFTSRAAAQAVAHDPSRMALGWVKMILVYVGGFFTIRFLAGRQGTPVMRPPLRSILRYLPYVGYALLVFAGIFYADLLVAPSRVNTARGIIGGAQLILEPLLMPWIVSAATDGAVRTPWQSARLLGWGYPRAFALFFLARIPVGAAHQFLGTYGVGRPALPLWPMLAADAFVVGLLIATIPAIAVRVARRTTLDQDGLRE